MIFSRSYYTKGNKVYGTARKTAEQYLEHFLTIDWLMYIHRSFTTAIFNCEPWAFQCSLMCVYRRNIQHVIRTRYSLSSGLNIGEVFAPNTRFQSSNILHFLFTNSRQSQFLWQINVGALDECSACSILRRNFVPYRLQHKII